MVRTRKRKPEASQNCDGNAQSVKKGKLDESVSCNKNVSKRAATCVKKKITQTKNKKRVKQKINDQFSSDEDFIDKVVEKQLSEERTSDCSLSKVGEEHILKKAPSKQRAKKVSIPSSPCKNLKDLTCTVLAIQRDKKDSQAKEGSEKAIDKSDSSSDESQWEDVEEASEEVTLENYKPEIPKEGVQITVDVPECSWRKRKQQFDIAEYLRRRINKFRKDVQLAMHKVHLLCLVANGIFVNNIINGPVLKGFSLSVIPKAFYTLCSKNLNVSTLEKLLEWYCANFKYEGNEDAFHNSLETALINEFEMVQVGSTSHYAFILVAICRTLKLNTRLCFSLYPLPMKPSNLLGKKPNNKPHSSSSTSKSKKIASANHSVSVRPKTESVAKFVHTNGDGSSLENDALIKSENKDVDVENVEKKLHVKHVRGKRKASSNVKVSRKDKTKNKLLSGSRTDKSSDEDEQPGNTVQYTLRPRAQKISKRTNSDVEMSSASDKSEEDSEFVNSDSDDSEKDFVAKKSVYLPASCKDLSVAHVNAPRPKKSKGENRKALSSESDDFEEEYVVKKSGNYATSCKNLSVAPINEPRSKSSKGKNRKVLSSDSDDDDSSNSVSEVSAGIKHWIEIYSKDEKRWICIDPVNKTVDKPYAIESHACQPMKYVISVDNKTKVKDVTKRYASNWLTTTRKSRVDEEWWNEALEPFAPPNNKQGREEETQLNAMLSEKPLPATIGEYKNHPLYALKRHLLKFEAIYPPDAPPLGFIRKEPVYARECVQTLRSRETWLKEARVVKQGEEPYKIVKARPKWDKFAKVIVKDLPLEIFGHWQTEPYVPPAAKNGKVPRNEYGNVELFKPCMLPKGTVHLQLPGLARVAKKLGIDCAPALIGFDLMSGGFGGRPAYDGWVVCKEYKNTLIAAWEEEQENIRKREEEKKEKRVYGNWKRLIKGLLIRERLKTKYHKNE